MSMDSTSISPPSAAGIRWDRLPAATCVILGLNIVIFILMTLSGGSQNTTVLLNFGASYGPYFRAGEVWRLVMPMFLHIGLAHLAVNMAALYLLGALLEPLYGYGRFSLLYVLSGMGGSLLSMEASAHIAAGASGAIFGIAGAMLVTGLLRPQVVPYRWKNLFGVGILIVIIINLIFGHFVPHIDNWAHLGGLVTGMALAWLVPPVMESVKKRGRAAAPGIQWIAVLPVVLVAVAAAATASHYLTSRQVFQLLADSGRLEAQQQPKRAIELLKKARQLDPRNSAVHEQLGTLYLEAKQYPQAIDELRRALRLSPDPSADTIRLAVAYEQAGDLNGARKLLEEAAHKMSGDAGIHEALAELCVSLKLFPEAISHYKRVLQLAPNSPLALNNLAWLYATCPDDRYRNPKAALQTATRAVELTQWRQPGFVDTLAAALYANRRWNLAAQVEARAVQLDPQNQTFQDNLAHYRHAAKP